VSWNEGDSERINASGVAENSDRVACVRTAFRRIDYANAERRSDRGTRADGADRPWSPRMSSEAAVDQALKAVSYYESLQPDIRVLIGGAGRSTGMRAVRCAANTQ